ncbi:MAG: Toxin SymE, type toxin-antitoxin system [Chthoniobacter sp.]|nr:Toxin SymE, type toxin-antitoxin system [Chthoniobacter sp.]
MRNGKLVEWLLHYVAIAETRRQITVGRLFQHTARPGLAVSVPQIRLSGKWLADAGFREGDTVEIAVEPGRLTLVDRATPGRSGPPQRELF